MERHRPGRVVEAQIVDRVGDDMPVEEWDRLAVAVAEPYSAPGWMLTWWRNAAPKRAELRVVVVRDGGEVIGVAPLFVQRSRLAAARYRFLAAGVSHRVGPVAASARELDVARAVTRALAEASPTADVVRFEGLPSDSPWPRLFRETWPGAHQPLLRREWRIPAPWIALRDQPFDAWLQSRSRNFRHQYRRRRRQLAARGAVAQCAYGGGMTTAVAAFAKLHRQRWGPRGGSDVLTPQVERMLHALARQQEADDRFRIVVLEAGGVPIAAHVLVAAGGTVSYWLGGFDEAWSKLQPGVQALVAAVEHAFTAGDSVFDLGGGGQRYKYDLTHRESHLEWSTLVPRGPRLPLGILDGAPATLRRELGRRLADETKRRLKSTLRGVRASGGSGDRRNPGS